MLNWFPGHMAVARREIEKAMPKMDLVIEVLDARMPFSSENPLVAPLRGDRPCIQILNKADLADPEVTELWLSHLEAREGVLALAHQHDQSQLNQRLLDRVRSLVEAPPHRPITAMIVGIPNVGKSTLINNLCGRAIAKTGNKPAITQRQQRIKVGSGLVLWDTPGFLWHRLSPPACGHRLAITGAISDRILVAPEIADLALTFLLERYPERIQEGFGLTEVPTGEQALLEAIGQRLGYLRKGGVIDLDRTANTILRTLRSGGLGRISLERPEDIVIESEEIDVSATKV